MNIRHLLAGLATACAVAAMPSASAAVITFNLDFEFSGGTPPAGSTPWVTATFEDLSGGGVRLTISNSGLSLGEFNSDFYFNLNPAKNAVSFLGASFGITPGTQTAWTFVTAGTNCCQADGDGNFDFRIRFRSGDNEDRFTAGETFVVEWGASFGLTATDFNYASVDGPVGKTGFYAAAHIQGIGENAALSGWIGARNGGSPGNGGDNGGGPGSVPEPATLGLIGLGMLAVGALRRRRSDASH